MQAPDQCEVFGSGIAIFLIFPCLSPSFLPSFLPSCSAGGGPQVLSNIRPVHTNDTHSSFGIFETGSGYVAKAGLKFMSASTSRVRGCRPPSPRLLHNCSFLGWRKRITQVYRPCMLLDDANTHKLKVTPTGQCGIEHKTANYLITVLNFFNKSSMSGARSSHPF